MAFLVFVVMASRLQAEAKADRNVPIAQNERITLVIIPFENQTGKADSSHWGLSISGLLKQQLKQMTNVCILPDSSLKFGLAELRRKNSEKITLEEVQKLGFLTEAQYVLIGQYRNPGQKWELTIQVIDVASNQARKSASASSSDWLQIVSTIRERILSELDLIPSSDEKQRSDRQPTQSSSALEFVSRALSASDSGQPLTNVEALLRDAIRIDSKFAAAQQALAQICMLQGKVAEARQTAELAVQLRPDLASTHFTYGSILFAQGLMNLARSEFREAIKCDPDETKSYIKLSEIYANAGKLQEAVSVLQTASRIAPHDARVLAALAKTYVQLGDSDKAWLALRAADKISDRDLGIEQLLAECYLKLGEPNKALEHYEQCLAEAREVGLKTGMIEDAQNKIAELELRMSVHFVTPQPVQKMSEEQLEAKLRETLNADEYTLIMNPLASTPEMNRWAEKLVEGSQDDLERARRLFFGLRKRINLSGNPGGRTAVEVFRDWGTPSVKMDCEDFAILYVAMSRHVGLQSYYVLVNEDYRGRIVNHACAGVVMANKALLVDLAYGWFGVPHKLFEFENDQRLLAFYLAHSGNPRAEDMALKMVPDWATLDFVIAAARVKRGDEARARQALDFGLKKGSNSWQAFLTEAIVDSHISKDWPKVVTNLRKCLQLYPDATGVRYLLGVALASQGELAQARDEFRVYLQETSEPAEASKAMDAIARINESLRNPLLPR